MSKLTWNNKDYCYRLRNFIGNISLLEEEVNIAMLQTKVQKFIGELVDDDIIDETSLDKLRESITSMLCVMLDNSKEVKHNKYLKE